MRKYFFLILAAAACLTGCKDDRKPENIDITGIWNIMNIEQTTKSAAVGNQTIDVYIEFKSDNTFSLYQMLGSGSFRRFKGTWSLDGNVLNGKYSDNSPWGTSYEADVDGDVLTLASPGEIYTYKRSDVLPEDYR